MNCRLLLVLPVLVPALCQCQPLAGAPAGPRVADPALREISGLANSLHDPTRLWAINDSGGAAQLHLMDGNGTPRGVMTLKGVANTDWEDLCSFTFEGKGCLLVADVGDNQARRDVVSLHLVHEPTPPAAGAFLSLETAPEWTLRFRYPDGPRDAESIAVDVPGRRILILSKRDRPNTLYQLPLKRPKGDEVQVAEKIGTLEPLPLPPKSLPMPHAWQPTSMDISSDGKRAALLTYRGVFLINRGPGQTWREAFRKPEFLTAHSLAQAEALTFTRAGRAIIVTSEGSHPPLLKIPVE